MSSLDWIDIEIVLRGKRVKGRYIRFRRPSYSCSMEWHSHSAARHFVRLAKVLLRELASREQEK